MLTHQNPLFSKQEVLSILTNVHYGKPLPEPHLIDGKEYWGGHELFSLILPDDLRMTFRASICQNCPTCKKEECEIDAFVKIRNGVLLQGTIDEKAIGSFKGRILDKITRDYGPDASREFLDNVTKIAIGAIMVKGFTTGIDDEDIPAEATAQITDALNVAIRKVSDLVEAYHEGILEQMPGRTLDETLEVEVMKVLGRARDEAGQIAGRHLGMHNSAVIMARSGARGSMLNLSQMAGCTVSKRSGRKASRGYWNLTLPHFKKGDLGAEAKGCQELLQERMTPTEFFFHPWWGKVWWTRPSGHPDPVTCSAVSSAPEDLVKQDGTVRNTADMIVQLHYGEDGIDPTRSVHGDAVDVDDILSEVLGDEADLLAKIGETKQIGYATVEKDLMETIEEEELEEPEYDMGGDD